ncbi:MAG TPA: hypothetical protein VFS67_26440 [Polyangiaceae bacterium]|nr:hypothetical protein [Polyangiaceae bacterium]
MPSRNLLSSPLLPVLGGASLLALLAACNPAADGKPDPFVADTPVAPPASSDAADAQRSPTSAPVLSGLVDGSSAPAAAAPDVPPSCSSARAQPERIREAVDIVVVLDNSGSMSDEAQSVEANLNVNFAQILAGSGVDYRLILISRQRTSSGQRTSACISQPLSGLAQCPADQPLFSDRFFQYSVEVGSHNSLSLLLDTYDGTQADEFELAPHGWSEWLRPTSKKVFLEFSDDDSRMEAASFLSDLMSLAPEHFGTNGSPAQLVWHSIVGLAQKDVPTEPYLAAEPVQDSECRGNTVFSAGGTYQDLSRLTGGLRFPICEFAGYDRVFQAIADDVVTRTGLSCGFPIPAPPSGQRLELDKVAVAYTRGDGSGVQTLGQVTDPSKCGDDAFLIRDGAIDLCPQACARIQRDALATVDVVFSCASTLILR